MSGLSSLLRLLAPAGLLLLLTGCPSAHTDDQGSLLDRELGVDVPLWVEVECSGRGRASFGDYSILKMPNEKVQWVLAKLGEKCRVYGAIIPKTSRKADPCDIRLRSVDPVVETGRCKCVPGRYLLHEGRPTSKRCCERFPDRVYCKEDTPPLQPLEEEPPSP
jgi:hypothetical protein